MKSYDYEAVVYGSEIYCVGCLPDGVSVDSEEVSPIFADSEWDHYPVCDECGEVHKYMSLTAEGREYECEQTMIYITRLMLSENPDLKTPYDLNDGYCQEWAERVSDIIDYAEVEETPEEYDGPGHMWLKVEGRYYDAECQDGVDDWKMLPVFVKYRARQETNRAQESIE